MSLDGLLTDDPHCAGCGQPYLTTRHYCGGCWHAGWPTLRHCPACGHDVAALVDETVAVRARRTSWDVSATGVGSLTAERLNVRERVARARREAS